MNEPHGVVERLHQTLVEAERDLRLRAEAQIRAYHVLLQDLVHRLGLAEHLDEMRHLDPNAPAGWGPSEWRKFLQQALDQNRTGQRIAPSWGLGSEGQVHRATRIESLERALRQAEGELQQAMEKLQAQKKATEKLQAQKKATQKPRPERHPSSGQPYYQDLREALKGLEIPPRTALPIEQRDWLPTGTRYKRAVQALWLLAQGLSIRLEMDWVLAWANGLKPRTGSIRRLFQWLVEHGLAVEEALRLSKPTTRLSLVRLTEKGKAVAQVLGFEVREGEWERLLRLHEGDRFSAHTVAVLIFALHARLRGWRAQVMPEAQGKTPPDVLVLKDDQRLFVEVERGEREKATKWRNIAQLNGGRVALCAMTPDHRALLVGDCKKQSLPGLATDLESLIAVPWANIDAHTPLWLEEWT